MPLRGLRRLCHYRLLDYPTHPLAYTWKMFAKANAKMVLMAK